TEWKPVLLHRAPNSIRAPFSCRTKEESMKPEEMVALYEYNAWADRRALQAASALTREQFTKQLGSSFSSVRDTLSHIYGVEWLWLQRAPRGPPPALTQCTAFVSLTH